MGFESNNQAAPTINTSNSNFSVPASQVTGMPAWATATLIGTANQIVITPVGDTLVFSTPQNIAVASSPTFAGLTLTTGLTASQGSLTTDTKAINSTATWNNAGVTFTHLYANVTVTAANAASKLIDLAVGGTTRFSFDLNGKLVSNGGLSGFATLGTAEIGNVFLGTQISGSIYAVVANTYAFGNYMTKGALLQSDTMDTFLQCATGKSIFFRVEGANIAVATATAWDFTAVTYIKAKQLLSSVNAIGASGASKTISWSDGQIQTITLDANCTLTLSNPVTGCIYRLIILQDGTGSRTITWPASVLWPSGTAPTLTTTANRRDVIELYWDGTNYLGRSLALNYT